MVNKEENQTSPSQKEHVGMPTEPFNRMRDLAAKLGKAEGINPKRVWDWQAIDYALRYVQKHAGKIDEDLLVECIADWKEEKKRGRKKRD